MALGLGAPKAGRGRVPSRCREHPSSGLMTWEGAEGSWSLATTIFLLL